MKQYFSLILFLLICLPGLGQVQLDSPGEIKKQLEALDTAYAKGDYTLAKEIADKIYSGLTGIKDDTILVDFLSTCGSVYYKLEDHARAGAFFSAAAEKANTVFGENGYPYALAIFNLASCYKEEGRYPEAEPLYLKSLPVLAPAFGQGSLEYTRCFYTLASMYIDMGRFAEAESMCAAAVNFYKTTPGQTSDDYLGALGSMGVIYMGQAKYEKAEEIFLSLKTYHSSLPDPPKETLQILENNLGDLYRHMGDYDRAEPALIHAVTLAGNTPAAAFSLNNLALVQKALGKYAEAEASYKRALGVYQALGRTNHPDYTNPLNNLGELYRVMGRLQEAVYAFEEVIVLRKKLLGTLHVNYANAVNNLALVEFATGKYPEAEKHLLECKDIYGKTVGEKDKNYANCLNNLASVYKMKGELLKAEEYYKQCLQIFKATYGETSDKYGIYLGGLAGTYRQMKRYDEAIAMTLQSLAVLKNKLGENHYDHIETEYNLAETYREAGHYKEAKQHYQNSMKGYLLLIEKYFPFLSEKDKTSFYYNVANAFETFNSFVIERKLAEPGEDDPALVERMYNNQVALKSLLLKESGKLREMVAAGSDEPLKKDYRQWMALRETIVQQYRLSAEDREAKGVNLAELELRANDLEQKINIAVKMNNPAPVLKTVTWKEVQAALEPGECSIEIVRTDYYTHGRWTDTVHYSALIIDKTCTVPQLVVLPNGTALETKYISAYRTAIRSRLNDESSYTHFWAPLKKYVDKASKIYFSPDGVYQQLNLYTLKDPGSHQYLLQGTNISLVTNTRDILQKRTATFSKTAVLFSYPDFGALPAEPGTDGTRMPGFPELKDLPGTKIESDSVKKILTDQRWKVSDHLQKDASESALKKVKGPQVLHIATHGFFLKDIKDSIGKVYGIESGIAKQNPLLRSGVILAGAAAMAKDRFASVEKEDGILTAYEAAGLDLTGTDLVILSACETGLGEMLNGQGVYGLQRAFFVAGARSMIMSLWKVDDKATQELMVAFYREWLADPQGGKQKALKAAQLTLKERYNSPYYWGAFVLVGE